MPDEPMPDEVPPRSLWSGTITFGLVSIPVSLFPAARPQRIALRMVDEQGTPLARRYICSKDEKPLEWDDIVRGYEIAKGEYVVVTDDELEALEPRKSRDIDVRQFVPGHQLDAKFFERGYFLTPAGDSTKAYSLLAAVMERSGRTGIATFVMRGKEYLVAIMAENGILRAETLRFADEIRLPDQVGLPEKPKLKAADVKAMEAAVGKHVSARLAPSELGDRQAQRLLKLVRSKERRHQDVVELPAEEAEKAGTEITDLMEILRRSLHPEARTKPRKRKAA